MLAAYKFCWTVTLITCVALSVEAAVTGEKWCNSVRVITVFAILIGAYLTHIASYLVSLCYW